MRLIGAAAALAIVVCVRPANAQAPWRIAGQVRAADGGAIAGATISIRAGTTPTAPLAATRSDSSGSYRATVVTALDSLSVEVVAIGYAPFATKIGRAPADSVLVLTIALRRSTQALAPVRTVAQRPRVAKHLKLAGSEVSGLIQP